MIQEALGKKKKEQTIGLELLHLFLMFWKVKGDVIYHRMKTETLA